MNRSVCRERRRCGASRQWLQGCLASAFALALLGASTLEAAPAASASRAAPQPERRESSDFTWRSLSAAQRRALQPLEREWGGLDLSRRQKWLEIANRFPNLSAADQARAQARMAQWAELSPEDRGKARLLFQQAKQVSPSDRGSKWAAYQSLPEEERKQLVERAASTTSPESAKPLSSSVETGRGGEHSVESRRTNAATDGRSASALKSNLVPNPALAAPPMPVSPTVTQAGPGATTSLMSKRAEPPPHQQIGLPKIAAMPGFVDQTTLQPKRGPQAAATRPATASSPVARP